MLEDLKLDYVSTCAWANTSRGSGAWLCIGRVHAPILLEGLLLVGDKHVETC